MIETLSSAVNNSDLSVDRMVARSDFPANLVVFTDASKMSYGIAIYVIQNGRSSLLFSKSKLAPEPSKTLHSLELLAAYMGLKCVQTIVSNVNFNLDIKDVKFVLDSQVALNWLIFEKVNKKNIFVCNRIKEIVQMKQSLANYNLSFHFVPSEYNVADYLTKPVKCSKFVNSIKDWLCGPEWILQNPKDWPKGNLGCLPSSIADGGYVSSSVLLAFNASNLVPFERHSSYTKLLSVTMAVMKAKNIFLKLPVNHDEIKNEAFQYLVSKMQSECFPEELTFLKSCPSNYHNVPTLVNNLNLFLDSKGLIRTRGRISNYSKFDFDSLNPVLLGKNHHLSKLIVRSSHFDSNHLGTESTLDRLRQSGFWLPQARHTIKKVLKECIICNKYNSRSFKTSFSPPLPSERVNYVRPFQHTGVDFTGHFQVMGDNSLKKKVYILLFTCTNTRFVHLKLVDNMSIEDFLLAFIRFHNRFGFPKVLYSDNAKTFTSGSNVISDLIASDTFQKQYIRYNLTHKTIPIYSPWYGACWERLIKTVKSCLYKSIGRTILSVPHFLTILSDVQLAVNNRPLTFVDRESSIDAITPNDLISPSSHFHSLIITDIEQNLEDLDNFVPEDARVDFVNSLQRRDILLSRFQRDWYPAYLASLRVRHTNGYPSINATPKFLKAGSVVLVRHPVKSRPYWSMARITEIVPGSDGKIRVVKIRTSQGKESCISVSNLYPLELES